VGDAKTPLHNSLRSARTFNNLRTLCAPKNTLNSIPLNQFCTLAHQKVSAANRTLPSFDFRVLSLGRAAALLLMFVATLACSAPSRAEVRETVPQSAPQSESQSRPYAESGEGITHYSLPPDKLQKAIELSRIERELYFAEVTVDLVALILILRLGVAAKFRHAALRASRRSLFRAFVFAALMLLTLALVELPFRVYGHTLSVRYALSVQGWSSWLLDRGKSELITIAIGGLLAALVAAVIRRSPNRWWFALWLLVLPLIVIGAFVEPLVIEPLFYDFRPLAGSHPALTAKIESLAAAAGAQIPRERMFEMLASQKLNALNAYVTGVGPSKRLVVWDTLFRGMTDDEIVYVVGHELGHYVLNHVWEGIGIAAVGLFFALWLLAAFARWALARWSAAWKIPGVDDLAFLAVLWLLFTLLSLASTPIVNATSRYIEHQADVFGLEAIHGIIPDEHQVAARAEQILGEVDLEEPDPSWFTVFWFDDHPPIAERLDFALHYDPWSQGRAPKFIHK
jgi:STE24 endopeptidase